MYSKFLLKVMQCCQPLILTATCHWALIDCAHKRKIIIMLLATCSYISKIMPIIILVFVNHDHFS